MVNNKLCRSCIAVAVLSAMSFQNAYAVISTTVGPINGRQIVIDAPPSIVGVGDIGSLLNVTVPATSDLDGDALVDWQYVWKVDNINVGTIASAGSTTTIPTYTIQRADSGKVITICLQAVADPRSYPVATKVSTEMCSTPLTVNAPILTIQNAGAVNIAENSSFTLKLDAVLNGTSINDGEWSVSGGADAALFSIAPDGTLSMVGKNFESPSDTNKDNAYDVTVQVIDPVSGVSATGNMTINVTDIGEAFTASTTKVSGAVADGAALNSATLTLVDGSGVPVIGETITISTDKGVLSNTELVTDAAGQITVTLTHTVAEAANITFNWDDVGTTGNVTESVNFVTGGVSTVELVGDGGAVLADPLIVGTTLHSKVLFVGDTTPQIDPASVNYQWQRRDVSSGTPGSWSDVSGANAATYTVTNTDQGYEFRVDVIKP